MKKVLLTGCSGYIGSKISLDLIDKKYHVIGLDKVKPHFTYGKNFTFIKCDLLNSNLIKKIDMYKIDSVIHLAGSSIVSESNRERVYYFHNNIGSSLNLISICKTLNIKKFIFSSTAAVYGNSKYKKISEKAPLRPINPYGKSKKIIEEILQEAYEDFGLNTIVLRYFNASGADEVSRSGEDHNPETHLIPNVLIPLTKDKSTSVNVFGNDYNTKDGTCIRDFIHVSDLSKAHILSMNWLAKNDGFNVFNLGNSKGYSVLEIIEMCKKITGKNININYLPRREGDPDILISNIAKASAILKWRPMKSLDDIILDAWKWHKNRHEN